MVHFHPAPKLQKFCTQCGSPLERIIPPGDNRERDTCLKCGAVHYKNPLIVSGTLTLHEGKILLCRRGIEPRYGKWTLPAGFMELHESTMDGAIRETMEEASASIKVKGLLSIVDVPYVSQVHMMYLADMENVSFNPCEETLEIGFFSEDEIPWSEIAFDTVLKTLEYFFLPETQKSISEGIVPTITLSIPSNNIIS